MVEDVRRALMEGQCSVPAVGSVDAGVAPYLPYVVVDAGGREVEPVSVYLRDLMLGDVSPLTCRSYGFRLLRWHRLIWFLQIAWEKVTEIAGELYQRWRDQVAVRVDGKGRRDFDPILRAVRAFYADLQAWAAAEPGQWAIWVAPRPVSDADVRGYGIRKRRVKERMDDRTRQRQPLLSTLVEYMENRYGHLRELLAQVSGAVSGETVTVEGRTYRPLRSRVDERRVRLGGAANVRALDLENGKYINVTHAEDAAFWEWAIVEVLRHSGVRIEEALELTHLSIRQYQRPNGEVIALLVVAPSKSDRERVIPMSAELFAVVAAIVRRHATGGETIPLLSRSTRKSGGAAHRCRSCSSARSAPSTRPSPTPPS